MPFCSRRTWKTPAGFTTWPTPGCYDGVVLPRFQSSHPDRKTAGVYHYNHPDTAADVGLRGLLLSRLNRVHWPTFIPALTIAWQRGQDVYREVRDRMRRHKNQLELSSRSGRGLLELAGDDPSRILS